jgi:hypothetical protein
MGLAAPLSNAVASSVFPANDVLRATVEAAADEVRVRVAIVAIARMIGMPIKPHLKAGPVVQLRRLLSILLALRPRRGADLDQCRPTLISGTHREGRRDDTALSRTPYSVTDTMC